MVGSFKEQRLALLSCLQSCALGDEQECFLNDFSPYAVTKYASSALE